MPTLAQLQREVWWGHEFTPPAMATLRSQLLSFWGLPSVNIGVKGDTNHLAGYHRSSAWIKNSVWCRNFTYSVSETPGNRNPGNQDWLCAMDITLNHSLLLATCQRLDRMIRSGALEKVTEWYGNLNGDERVDGYDNIRNRVATSDPSHLWHLHLSFDRGRANEDHTDLYRVLTGAPMTIHELHAMLLAILTADTSVERQVRDMIMGGVQSPAGGRGLLSRVMDAVAEVSVPDPAPVDPEVLRPIIREVVREELDATRLTGPTVTP
jgi:hypothetical protein